MMKKLIVLAIAAAMVFGLSMVAVAAPDADWIIHLRASTTGNLLGTTGQFGTKTGATDDPTFVIGEDGDFAGAPPGKNLVELWGTDITGHEVISDKRAPITTGKKVWHIVVTPEASYTGTIQIRGWNQTGTAFDLDPSMLPALTVKLYLGSEATGQLLWTVDQTKNGTSTSPNYTGSELQMGTYDLTLVAAVPEPGSIIALLTGLVGLYGIRRRR